MKLHYSNKRAFKLSLPEVLETFYNADELWGIACEQVYPFSDQPQPDKKPKKTVLIELLLNIFSQVLDGICHLHELGITHGDIKPQNIMIDSDGAAKIMDFGIARSVETPRVTAAGMMIGTPEYMSPEQVAGDPTSIDTRCPRATTSVSTSLRLKTTSSGSRDTISKSGVPG